MPLWVPVITALPMTGLNVIREPATVAMRGSNEVKVVAALTTGGEK